MTANLDVATSPGTPETAEASALLATLTVLDRVRREIDQHEYLVVGRLQEMGTPWSTVGAVYGISRQAARDRFVRARRRDRR